MNCNNEFYPKLLVFLQFSFIAAMLVFLKYANNSNLTLLCISIFAIGGFIGIWALNHNQLDNFNIQPKLKDNAELVTTGIYKYIRHPMYFSVILMAFSLLAYTHTLVEIILFFSLVFTLILKARREESLWIKHDKNYLSYKNRTKLIIPFVI